MNLTETALLFECQGEELVGIVSRSHDSGAKLGVLIVVGGPQYRVGSHRQFALLARYLAAHNIPCMRFDYRGMGDSTGASHDFNQVDDDINAALAAFIGASEGLERVVLWGLCDGASAICLGLEQREHVAGAVLLNPWVRTEATEAGTMLRHYYLRRLLDRHFWVKLVGGGVRLGAGIQGVLAALIKRLSRSNFSDSHHGCESDSLPMQMLDGLRNSSFPCAVFLSGRDYVAREFELCVKSSPGWSEWLNSPDCHVQRFDQADHTFSNRRDRDAVATATLEWCRALDTKVHLTELPRCHHGERTTDHID